MAPASGICLGGVLRIQAWVCLRRLALASGIRFGFGRWVCTLGKALLIQGCAIVSGIVQLSGKQGEKLKYCKINRKELP